MERTIGARVFVSNITGSFLIGLFLTLSEERFLWPSQLCLLVAIGFLGGFTTFSSLAWETPTSAKTAARI